MAAQGDVKIEVEVSGLGVTTRLPIEFTHSITPEEKVGPVYAVIGNTVTTLDLGTIAANEVSGILIIARVNAIGIVVSADCSETPSVTADNMIIEGDNNESVYLNFTKGLNASGGIRLLGDAATAAIEYIVYGSHS